MPDAGVVDEDLGRSEPLGGLGHQALAVVRRAHVGTDGDGAGQFGHERFETLDAAGRHRHLRAGRVQDSSEVRTETSRGAGHDRDATVESKDVERLTGVGSRRSHDAQVTSGRPDCSDCVTTTPIR